MRHLIRIFQFLILVSGVGSVAVSQTPRVSVEYLMGEKQQLVEVYELDKTNPYLVLKMGFANDSILNPQVAKALKGKGIHTIELVYTNYRAAPGFNQPDLNYKRLTNLYKLAPWIFDQTNIKWVFVAQTKCGNSDECSKLFHGFVIHFQQPVTKESAK